ncbi:MAG TPA: PAS domain-containing protein [Vicinamibacterales bacterium]|nr:PAS domain-containing protein [Vicinamibacterales bacterium]
MAIDVLELQLASALQRFATLQRRATSDRDHGKLLGRSLQELGTALEEVRVAQEQLIEGRQRLEALQLELARERERYWQLFDQMPQPYVVTEPSSVITEVNRAAAQLFNVSQRFLVGKALSVFVCEERARFLADISRLASEGRSAELTFKLRPRERAPVDVTVVVGADARGLRWVFRTAAFSDPSPN